MMQLDLLRWCDAKISHLKGQGIPFINGIPQLPEEFIFRDMPKALSTYKYRRDIPENVRKDSLIVFYMYEIDLWPRLNKIETDLEVLKTYGGIVGFDLSPSIGMLRPRQRLSILVNAVYSCYCGTKGIKVLPNYRAGDFGTICAADFFPDDCSFMIGNLGCASNGFRKYGEYQLDILLLKKRPKTLFVYGSITRNEAARLIKQHGFEIITFPDRRNRIRNNSKSYRYYLSGDRIVKALYADATKGGVA